jgi:hypothetical protein
LPVVPEDQKTTATSFLPSTLTGCGQDETSALFKASSNLGKFFSLEPMQNIFVFSAPAAPAAFEASSAVQGKHNISLADVIFSL